MSVKMTGSIFGAGMLCIFAAGAATIMTSLSTSSTMYTATKTGAQPVSATTSTTITSSTTSGSAPTSTVLDFYDLDFAHGQKLPAKPTPFLGIASLASVCRGAYGPGTPYRMPR